MSNQVATMMGRDISSFARASLFMGFVTVALGSAASQQAASSQTTAPPARAQGTRFHEPDPIDFDEHTGFVQIFDGKTLNKWDGDPQSWRVEDGAIVGESTTAEETTQ